MKNFFSDLLIMIGVIAGFLAMILGVIGLAVLEVMFYALLITLVLLLGFKVLGLYAIGTFIIGFWNIFKVAGVVLLIGKAIIAGFKMLTNKK